MLTIKSFYQRYSEDVKLFSVIGFLFGRPHGNHAVRETVAPLKGRSAAFYQGMALAGFSRAADLPRGIGL
jgi:hypothetical protein